MLSPGSQGGTVDISAAFSVSAVCNTQITTFQTKAGKKIEAQNAMLHYTCNESH